MQPARDYEKSEIAVLGIGVEATLRRIVRFLVGKISLVKLKEMIDFLYIEELEKHLTETSANGRFSLGTLALNTGYDTRVVNRFRLDPRYKRSIVRESDFLQTASPGTYILHVWSTDKRFIDPETGKPRELEIDGKTGLSRLAESVSFPRGVTVKTVLNQLLSSGHIVQSEDGRRVAINRKIYIPSASGDREGAIEAGFHAVARLLDTVLSNLDEKEDSEKEYQRLFWIHRTSPHQLEPLKKEIGIRLKSAEKDLYEILNRYDEAFDSPEQVTVGVGLFQFSGGVD